jgi:hypothetical protein
MAAWLAPSACTLVAASGLMLSRLRQGALWPARVFAQWRLSTWGPPSRCHSRCHPRLSQPRRYHLQRCGLSMESVFGQICLLILPLLTRRRLDRPLPRHARLLAVWHLRIGGEGGCGWSYGCFACAFGLHLGCREWSYGCLACAKGLCGPPSLCAAAAVDVGSTISRSFSLPPAPSQLCRYHLQPCGLRLGTCFCLHYLR